MGTQVAVRGIDRLVTPIPRAFKGRCLRNFDVSSTYGKSATFAEAVAAAQVIAACRGSIAAARELRGATEGRASDRPKETSGLVSIRIIEDVAESKNSEENSQTEAPEGS